jgi:hypothetical protein
MSKPFQLLCQARSIELDLIEVSRLDIDDGVDLRPMLKKFSERIGNLADALETLHATEERDVRNSKRWELLTTPGIKRKSVGDGVQLVQLVHDWEGNVTGSRLLAVGKTTTEVLDKALGYMK